MRIFDFEVKREALENSLKATYKRDLVIENASFAVKRPDPSRRLGLLTLTVNTNSGLKIVNTIVKESSQYEALTTSIANKILPYSSPKIIHYEVAGSRVWLFLENIETWLDITGYHRINELLIDGLFEIHKQTLTKTDTMLKYFELPVLSREVIFRRTYEVVKSIDNYRNKELEELGLKDLKPLVRNSYNKAVSYKDLEFPLTFIHNNYTHSSTRALKDEQGNVYVIAYDWVSSAIGWPQIDLATLFSRVDVLAAHQKLISPTPVMLLRYIDQVTSNFSIDMSNFYKVFDVCRVCYTIAIIRWWLTYLTMGPKEGRERAFLEVQTGMEVLLRFIEGGGLE